MSILEIKNLSVNYEVDSGIIKAVENISFSIDKGETLAIVGESGCGKSTTAHALMRLISKPGIIANGSIELAGLDLTKLKEKEMSKIRGKEMAMIFQEPMTSLNPVYRVGEQIAETIRIHTGQKRSQALEQAIQIMDRVGISNPATRAKQYPHQMSGGMRQRAMIAMALACEPKVLIADEPTTALDVTIQAQILRLMRKLQKDFNTAILFITHDLGVVAEVADKVAVMYCGNIVEVGPVVDMYYSPKHPYTKGLIESVPDVNKKMGRLSQIEGTVPDNSNMPEGCKFYPRCSHALNHCKDTIPNLNELGDHKVACFNPINSSKEVAK
jgi:oligopeptide/dipeptide ABC transporter ATP-binding protein